MLRNKEKSRAEADMINPSHGFGSRSLISNAAGREGFREPVS